MRKMSVFSRVSALAVAMAMSGFNADIAHADDVANAGAPQSGHEIGEIIVTAQRREQSAQKVGISITALSGDQMQNLGMVSTQSVASHVPGLIFDGGSGGGLNAFVTIRGVSQVDFSEHQEAPNAVYLDEVYVATPSEVGFPVYDMARMEALRGPQGTLFGRNSTGGLLQFVTADPTDHFTGFLNAEAGNYSSYRLEGAVGGPLGGGVNFRLSAFGMRSDGWYKNNLPGNPDSFAQNEFGVRLKLATTVSGWDVKLTGSYNKSPKHTEGAYKATPAYVDAQGVTQYVPANVDIYGTGAGNDPFGYRDPSTSPWSASFNSANTYLEKTYAYATLKVSGDIGSAKFSSISNYSRGTLNYQEDSDSTPNNIFLYPVYSHTRQFSQELRLAGDAGKLNWNVGAYFIDLNGFYQQAFNYDTTPFTLNPTYSFRSFTQNQIWQHTQSYAVFAQGEYALNDKLKLTVGARYNHDRKHITSYTYDTDTNTLIYDFSDATVGSLATMSHGDWAGKVELNYQAQPGVLLYTDVSRGIRGGGFNAAVGGPIPINLTPFKNEVVWAYEGGAKIRIPGGIGHINVSGYYYDYKNFQAFNFLGISSFTSNLNATMYGGEAELVLKPGAGFDLSFGGAYSHAKVHDLNTGIAIMDVDPVKSPHFTFNGIIGKEVDLRSGRLRLQYDFDYQGESRANLIPSPVTLLPSSWQHNVRVSFKLNDSGWEIYGYSRNVFNNIRKNFAYDNSFIGLAIASYAPPRTFGFGVRKSF